ncbi:hypothetical protein TRVL_05691 [Trypanosoma vivax]|nr:hypothetical protein TRVL_05691 [Trypanosoma vivax]
MPKTRTRKGEPHGNGTSEHAARTCSGATANRDYAKKGWNRTRTLARKGGKKQQQWCNTHEKKEHHNVEDAVGTEQGTRPIAKRNNTASKRKLESTKRDI